MAFPERKTMAGISAGPGYRPPIRRAGAAGSTSAGPTSAAYPGGNPVNASALGNSTPESRANEALNFEQEQAAFRSAYNANNYGVSTQAKGQSPTGSWATSAEPQPGDAAYRSPVITRARAGGGGAGGAGGGDGYENLTESAFTSAMRNQPPIPARESPISMMGRKPAEDAAYGRAKDQVGSEARGAADSLSDEMSARGISGSGVEGALLGGILQKGQGQLGEVNRDQAINYMQRADNVQDTNYQGGVQQRGQDIAGESGRSSNAMRLMDLLRRRKVG